MARIYVTGVTSITPEQFIAALTDFGPKRAQIWPQSQPKYFKIHAQQPTTAEVSEGSDVLGGIWERVQYDWSNPSAITLKTVDSNLWDDRSGWHYQIAQAPGGSTVITYSITRYPKNARGRLVLVLLALFGRRAIRRGFHDSLRAIESRHH
jgi:hypothetical protein